VRLFSENRLTYSGQCERQYPGAQDSDRRLGIGAVYPRPAVPVKDFNQLSFEEVIVMTSETELQSMSVVPPIEEVMTGCDVVWLRQYSASQIGYPSIPITTVLGDRTLCHNPYSSYASDFPGYGPVRAEIREPGPPIGEWYCESDAPAARFRLDREHDYYRLEMDNESFYVFAATDIIPHTGRYVESEIVPYGYVVRRTPSGGNPTSFEPVRFVSFGDGIGVHDEMRYYFTYENGTISTNWNANVCRQR
jgi:hypothetical protein